MKRKLIIIGSIAVVGGVCLLGCAGPNKHNYLVVLQTQTEPLSGVSKTTQIITSGSKFTLADANWVRTNAMADNPNMAVVILNIVKLDD